MFRRKRKVKNANPLQDKVAGKVASLFFYLQNKFSEVMTKIVSRVNTKELKMALVIFCILSGGLSGYFLVDALVAKPKPAIKIDPIKMPEHFDRSGDEVMENVLPEDIYREIQEYRRYMDSIGEPIRPGLQDSMRILEEIYLQQQK